MADAALRDKIKQVMVQELMLQLTAEQIGDDDLLFGPDGIGLDSVDALQLVVAIEKHFGLKVADTEEARGILRSVNTIAAAVEARPRAAG